MAFCAVILPVPFNLIFVIVLFVKVCVYARVAIVSVVSGYVIILFVEVCDASVSCVFVVLALVKNPIFFVISTGSVKKFRSVLILLLDKISLVKVVTIVSAGLVL